MHYVFLVHGAGGKVAGWSVPLVQSIDVQAKSILGDEFDTARQGVEFVEINYHEILANNIKEILKGGDSIPKVNDWLKAAEERRKSGANLVDAPDEQSLAANLVLEFLMDSLSYIWNIDMARFVLNKIATQVLPVIQNSNQGDKFSFVGHGIGSKILFDFLHQLYGGDKSPYQLTPDGSPAMGALEVDSLYLLGNTAHGLSKVSFGGQYDQNNSHIRLYDRMAIPRQGGVVRGHYRIINHQYDAISKMGKSEEVQDKFVSQKIELTNVTAIWMHQAALYFEHPAVNLSMIEDFYLPADKKVTNKDQIIASYNTSKNTRSIAEDLSDIFENYGDDRTFDSKITVFDYLKKMADAFLKPA